MKRLYTLILDFFARALVRGSTALFDYADKFRQQVIPLVEEYPNPEPSSPLEGEGAAAVFVAINKPNELTFKAVNNHYGSHGVDTRVKANAEKLAAGSWVGVLKRDANPNPDEPMATGVVDIQKWRAAKTIGDSTRTYADYQAEHDALIAELDALIQNGRDQMPDNQQAVKKPSKKSKRKS